MNGNKEIIPCSADHGQDWQAHPVDLYSVVCYDHTYMHIYILYQVGCTLNSRLLSGHLVFVAGTIRGSLFPVYYGSVGVQLTRLRRLNLGTLTSICVKKNLKATVLKVTCTRVFFCFFLYKHKSKGENVSIQYSSSSTNILYLNILYTNSGSGKNIWTPPWTSGAIP